MNENWLQIREHTGQGFQSLVFFEGWRVAILNYLNDIRPEYNNTMERHTETDEVFVLLKGRGVLIIGGNALIVDDVFSQVMEVGKIYNVRRNTWHTILLTPDASILLMENGDTGDENSEYLKISEDQHKMIMKIAQREGIGS
jgi:mannose-6-phosphate isomerase-like protein (cupin superfamily)